MESFDKIQQYIPAFEKKLDAIFIENLSVEPYYKNYLAYLLQHKRYYLEIYASVLELVLQHSSQPKEQISLIDYGAGNGLMGLFAKYCGFNKVYINDINASFTQSAVELAAMLDIPINGFITGDVIAIADYFKQEKPTAIAGTDVIEHIYSLTNFFNELHKINPAMVSVFTTASNPFNKRKVKNLQQLQLKDEYEGGKPEDYILFGENAIEPFIKIRESIIRKNAAEINENEILQLAKLTRGLDKDDIIKAVKKYKGDKVLPTALQHPTNTCDPTTGSWTERILTIDEYEKIYAAAGFNIKIYSGFYNEFSGNAKSFLLKLMNKYVAVTGHSMAPFISLVGIPNKNNN